jgi:hypothetical protein
LDHIVAIVIATIFVPVGIKPLAAFCALALRTFQRLASSAKTIILLSSRALTPAAFRRNFDAQFAKRETLPARGQQ